MKRMGSFRFEGGVAGFWGTLLLALLVTLFTLGLGGAYANVLFMRWMARHTYVDGRQLTFRGMATDLFGRWVLWLFLTLITFGIYGLWVYPKVIKWGIENLDFRDAAAVGVGGTEVRVQVTPGAGPVEAPDRPRSIPPAREEPRPTRELEPQSTAAYCAECGEALIEGNQFCTSCGTAVSDTVAAVPDDEPPDAEPAEGAQDAEPGEDARVCGSCGEEVPLEDRFCWSCGDQVGSGHAADDDPEVSESAASEGEQDDEEDTAADESPATATASRGAATHSQRSRHGKGRKVAPCPGCESTEVREPKEVAACTSCRKRYRRPVSKRPWSSCPTCGGSRRRIAATATCGECGIDRVIWNRSGQGSARTPGSKRS